ncbi:uncharacterized protein FOMMEDRAFT_168253 [Fomitiporia mediterranea MF3/22]|uniref:uncharacterized protein n=1 Tax=Fomitiporia mediterranea (strain MF3/22) TaxID=694068 RepID=UPI00044092B7|nr:uncharacterized protein FOMMEDRAFT_168253 [Fomitiporia mediterranea MF3/22]EJD03226.1 hypothetical protein FOMMEDRAFT_168253 [Fomitiporia mediterranea MF3/22]
MDPQDVASNINRQSIAERVINVHTTKEYDWVLENIFNEAKVGKRRVFFWKADKPGSCHFFVEFASKDFVPIAQREAGPGVTVHCLSRNMNMFTAFDCLSKGIELPKKRMNPDTEGSQAGDPPVVNRLPTAPFMPPPAKRPRLYDDEPPRRPSPPPYREAPYKPYRPSPNLPQNPRDSSQRNYPYNSNINPKSKPSWSNNITLDNRRLQSNNYQKSRFRNADFQSSNGSVSPPRRPREDNFYYGDREDDRAPGRTRDVSPHRTSRRRLSDTSIRRLSDASTKRPSDTSLKRPSNPTITPSSDTYKPASPHFSVPIVVPPPRVNQFGLPELEALSEDNIGAVIDRLKTSFSGPESWMTVAAHYRRKKLHKNALAVIDSMLEVMRDRGMDKADLRPALLLMAQCHHSIGKQERREPDSLEDSNKHFNLLLGWLRETYGPNTPAVDAIAQSAGFSNPWTTEKDNRPLFGQTQYDFTFRTPVPGFDHLQAPPSLFDMHSSLSSRLEAVTEENTRLRDAQSATEAKVDSLRATLQEAETSMRATEAKLERALDDLRIQTGRTLRESDGRRRAEDRLAQERAAWERRIDDLRDEGATRAVRDLNAIVAMMTRAPTSMLEATRVFCEARSRLERTPPDAP